MESVVAPVLVLVTAVITAYVYGGGNLFGIALTAVAMLSTVAITMTVDAYGPIADNAGGIAEMAHFGPNIRVIKTPAIIPKACAGICATKLYNTFLEILGISLVWDS